LDKYKLGIIGCGNMGESILKGVLDCGFLNSVEIIVCDKDSFREEYIKNNYKVCIAKGISELVEKSRYVLLAVKPVDSKDVLRQVKINFNSKVNSIITIMAGIPTGYIEKMLNSDASVVRIMPNVGALYRKGMAAVSKGRFVKKSDLVFSEKLIESVGDYVLIDEKYQNIATALNGSGPAYFFLFCKHLIDIGIKNGLEPETSKKLVIETMIGAGITIKESKESPDDLIKKVASRGGTTEAALEEFIKGRIDNMIIRAVESAKKRANEIEKSLDQ
jgi:pyrroline-5-carboxylate reductase